MGCGNIHIHQSQTEISGFSQIIDNSVNQNAHTPGKIDVNLAKACPLFDKNRD